MRFIVVVICCLIIVRLDGQMVSGIVLDPQSNPVAGANVYFLKGEIGTVTDSSGYFELSGRSAIGDTLGISHIGFDTYSTYVPGNWLGDLGTISLRRNIVGLPEATISAIRAKDDQPFAFQNFDKSTIERRNQGKDIPFLLQYTPSLVASSDAGNGIGYTSLRIRGSDQSRINVTINGIPYNDAESQQVFWVDLPDFGSSLNSLQIQRGLGTSSNGSGSFGGSIHLNTFNFSEEPYAEISNSFGSYNTRKHHLTIGTGRIGEHFGFSGKLAVISSDGYIDRASSDLKSYFLKGTYQFNHGSIHAMAFKGSEVTYQSWYGTPQSRLENDIGAMTAHAANNFLTPDQTDNLLNSGRSYNFYTYENQVDDYDQDHYQIHYLHSLRNSLNLKVSFHLTKGKGFFEEERLDELFSDYGLENPVVNSREILSTDLIRRRWLDNDFYGIVWEAEKDYSIGRLFLGGGYHIYEGNHFGEIIWSEIAVNQHIGQGYYFNQGDKKDFNMFSKYTGYDFLGLDYYLDIQIRNVSHQIFGTDNDAQQLNVDKEYWFFNPKLGISRRLTDNSRAYVSFGIGNREPDRNDLVDGAISNPEYERLHDLEAGIKHRGKQSFEINGYWMKYRNQLVLTGELNDVGAPLRRNVPESYRLGLEMIWGIPVAGKFDWNGSVNISKNRIKQFTEVLYDYTNGFDVVENIFDDSTISFSPSLIISNALSYEWSKDSFIQLHTKYVGDQYLDNTGNKDRKIENYLLHELSMDWSVDFNGHQQILLNISIHNLFNELYASNGYTFSYYFGELITENFFYPQAERHFLIGATIKL